MGVLSDFRVGQTVQIQDGRSGVVRFVGATHFSSGDWIGLELPDDSGKNDGSAQGQRYFQCAPNYGLFIRPAAATVTAEAPSEPPKRASVAKSRPSSIIGAQPQLKRQSIANLSTRRASNDVSSTSSVRKSISPTKLNSLRPSSRVSTGHPTTRAGPSTSTSRNAAVTSKSRASIASRPSTGPPAVSSTTKNTRLSTVGGIGSPTKPPTGPSQKSVDRVSQLQRNKDSSSRLSSQASARSLDLSPSESADVEGVPTPTSEQEVHLDETLSPADSQMLPPEHLLSPTLSQGSTAARAPTTKPDTVARDRLTSGSQKATASAATSSKKTEELEAKIRILEKKRMEDREKVKTLEKAQEDRDKFKSIIQKLEAKLQPQQQELTELRKRVKDAEAKADASDNQALDFETSLEMATLDREVAEEKADALQTKLNTVKSKLDELELEVEILREENEEFSKEVDPEDRAARGWIHLEKENDRIREALMRLRDASQDQEADLRGTVKSLEQEVDELRTYREKHDEVRGRLTAAEAQVEDLRENLETAVVAEDMIEELTEKNMSLTERIDSMKIEIEDLENLKELNEEIEQAHLETEKQLQDEIDYTEALYLEQIRQGETKDEAVRDLEYTTTRFRDLVSTLQIDLQEMRASQQLSETEANELSNRTREMMNLNLRLQTSASKSQVKAIEQELQKLHAQEVTKHLDIVQPFLPAGYAGAQDSVNALLRIRRVGFKANLMHDFVKERLSGVAVPGREDDMLYACEMLSKFTWINAICERFTIFAEACSTESFKRLEGAMFDLEPVERSFNAWIDALKKDSLREKPCSAELDRSIAIMTHLGEVHIPDDLREFAQDVRARALVMQSSIDSAVHVISHIKAIAQARVLLPVDADEEVEQEASDFLQKADGLIAQLRSAKITAGKSLQQLDELASRSLSLDRSAVPPIEQPYDSAKELLSACVSAGMSLCSLANEEGREDNLSYRDVVKVIASDDSAPFSSLSANAQTAGKHLQEFYNLTTNISHLVEVPAAVSQAPWTVLAQRVKDEVLALEKNIVDLGRANNEIAEKNTALAIKEKTLEEMSVNIEHLEKRVGESGGRREKLKELESTISTLEANEQELSKQLAVVEGKLDKAEIEKESWKNQAAVAGTKPGTGYIDEGLRKHLLSTNAILEDNVKSLITMVENLRSSVQSSRIHTSAASQQVATNVISMPIIPRKIVTKANLLGHEAAKVYRDTPTPKPEWTIKLKQLSSVLAWHAEREKVRFPLQEQDYNQGAWEDWRDDVYEDRKALGPVMMRALSKKKPVADRVMMNPWETML